MAQPVETTLWCVSLKVCVYQVRPDNVDGIQWLNTLGRRAKVASLQRGWQPLISVH